MSALRGNSLLFLADMAASFAATTISICFSHPIDTARVRAQTHRLSLSRERNPVQGRDHVYRPNSSERYLSPQALRARGEHLRSLYSGFLTPISTTGPVIAIGFALNELYQRVVCRLLFGSWNAAEVKQRGEFRVWHSAAAGSLAGATAAVVQAPIAVVRIRQQIADTMCVSEKTTAAAASTASTTSLAGSKSGSNSLRAVARRVLVESGVRGFYRGFPLEAAQAAVARLLYFTTWEDLRVRIPAEYARHRAEEALWLRVDDSALPRSQQLQKQQLQSEKIRESIQRSPPLWTQVLAGTCASWAGWTVIYPLDVCKSRIQGGVGASGYQNATAAAAAAAARNPVAAATSQERARRILCVAEDVYRHHGLFNGLYRGLSLTLLRGAVSSGASLPLYESYFKPACRRWATGASGDNVF